MDNYKSNINIGSEKIYYGLYHNIETDSNAEYVLYKLHREFSIISYVLRNGDLYSKL